jgi:hypothetical protein
MIETRVALTSIRQMVTESLADSHQTLDQVNIVYPDHADRVVLFKACPNMREHPFEP